jgi:hypothetical protein
VEDVWRIGLEQRRGTSGQVGVGGRAEQRLGRAAEGTLGERLTELLDGTALTTAARTVARLRATLERDQIGLPIG